MSVTQLYIDPAKLLPLTRFLAPPPGTLQQLYLGTPKSETHGSGQRGGRTMRPPRGGGGQRGSFRGARGAGRSFSRGTNFRGRQRKF
ncbi:hypothetical protein MXB_4670 [Myxobolus squamalis]|nr:hypothetical protein MXB_4670 [Myxobolus squamalis]